jgi:hypothetical protein
MGLSQEQFAFEADIHRTYISIEVLEKFVKALSVTPSMLLEADD